MGRVYIATIEDVSVTVDFTFFQITAPSDGMVRLLSAHIGQTTDEGDAEAENQTIQIQRTGAGIGTPTSITPRPVHVGHAAASSSVDRGPGQGTPQTELLWTGWNFAAGWHYEPVPAAMIWVPPSGFLGIRIPQAPVDAVTVSGWCAFEEFD